MSRGLLDLIDSRWFALADLACAAAGGFWCYIQPAAGGWPLLIALAPWAIRLAGGRVPYKRSAFDPLVAVFLLTALIGVWAAYDRGTAWAKLWVLIGSSLLFFALVAQPPVNLWPLAGLLGLLGAGISVFFLLTYDWRALPRHFAFLDRVGIWWMSIRPAVPGFLHPNVAGGLLAMLIPFQIALWMRAWRSRKNGLVLVLTALGGLAVVALVLTSSRGAWGALAIVLAGWGLWWLSGYVAERKHWPRQLVFGLFVGLMVGAALLVLVKSMDQVVALARSVPDAPSRYDLANNTLRLIGDFPYTGGGLGAFSGLYSRYMLGIQVPLFTYSHDFYLDVALEQGLFGLLALLAMLVGSLALLARPTPKGSSVGLLRWAVISGLFVISLHGLVEDALYGNQGTPLLLLLAGTAVSLARSAAPQATLAADHGVAGAHQGLPWPRPVVAVPAAILATAFFFVSGPVLVGAGYANLGAVQMARTELAGWDSAPVAAAPGVNALGPAQVLFERALQFDPGNRTARYRLGLIAIGQDDYQLAVVQMERAYQADPGHRGVTKALGYAYAWLGKIDRAHALLVTVPEAEAELTTYAWWWKTQGHDDRAAYAAQLATLLHPLALGQ